MTTLAPLLVHQLHEAQHNLATLQRNPYPGRGLVQGLSKDGHTVLQIYWLMGRSRASRARELLCEGETVRASPLGAPPERADLLAYTAMAVQGEDYIVGNGAHVCAIQDALGQARSVCETLKAWAHEDDPPHHTPRIAAGFCRATGQSWMSLLYADLADANASGPQGTIRTWYTYPRLHTGFGWCQHTYACSGTPLPEDPLPSFCGPPQLLPLDFGAHGTAEDIAQAFWKVLDAERRVALVLKEIPRQGPSRMHRIQAGGSD